METNYKKIILVGITALEFLPYAHRYIDELAGCELDFLYWSKFAHSSDETKYKDVHFIRYDAKVKNKTVLAKLYAYWMYSRFVLRTIKQGRYDHVIVLSTIPAVFISSYLIRHCKNKYVFDYRDYTYEKISVYKSIVGRLIKNALFASVSSPGFFNYVPREENVYVVHNTDFKVLEYKKEGLNKNAPIRICFWGLIRDTELNRRLIDLVKRDSRFELIYYGSEIRDADVIKNCVKEANASNIFYYGHYDALRKYDFIAEADILHNDYDVALEYAKNLISNKYYDGIFARIPQLCNADAFMGKLVCEKQVGISVSLSDNRVLDKIYEYYRNLDWDNFQKCCDRETDRIVHEVEAFSIRRLMGV